MNPLLHQNVDAAIETLNATRHLAPEVEQAAQRILTALKAGRKLLVCGNGGSAADAMHFATEFVCRFQTDRDPYPALCLNASGGDLTAIGNDYAFEDVFARQVGAFGASGDVLVAFTTSGQSENVCRALDAARERGLQRVAFLGRDGGRCRGRADVELTVPSDSTARIQEAHKVLLHTVCERVDRELVSAPSAPGS